MTPSFMTRRQALKAGATAGLVTMLGGPAAAARAAAGGPPSHLHRAAYAPLVGQTFTVGGHALRLAAVGDLAGAAATPRLRGHDGAFALTFEGPVDAFASGIQDFAHPALGRFALFAGPVGRTADGAQTYEVTVDRSVPIPETWPQPGDERPGAAPDAGPVADAGAPAPAGAATPGPAPLATKAKKATKATKRHRQAKRTTMAKRRRKARTRRGTPRRPPR